MADKRTRTTITIPSDLVIGGNAISAPDVVRWLKDLIAYRRSFEQIYWMASRYARSRESSAALSIYLEAIARVEQVGFVDLEKDGEG